MSPPPHFDLTAVFITDYRTLQRELEQARATSPVVNQAELARLKSELLDLQGQRDQLLRLAERERHDARRQLQQADTRIDTLTKANSQLTAQCQAARGKIARLEAALASRNKRVLPPQLVHAGGWDVLLVCCPQPQCGKFMLLDTGNESEATCLFCDGALDLGPAKT